jgi:dipeptidase E
VRLYLSSFRLGDHPERLRKLAGAGRRVAVIGNALDAAPVDVRSAGVHRELADFRELGFDADEVDLRSPEVSGALHSADVIWVRGGNVFVLRRALADSGMDRELVAMIKADEVVYAGYSAGACVLAPNLHGLEQVDDDSVVEQPLRDGLAILDRPVVPHLDSPGHPETLLCQGLSVALRRGGQDHWALRDGDVLLVQKDRTEVLGRTERSLPSPTHRPTAAR